MEYKTVLTINVPVVYTGRDVVIWMGATSITRGVRRVGMKIETGWPPNGPSGARAIWGPTGRDFHTHPF